MVANTTFAGVASILVMAISVESVNWYDRIIFTFKVIVCNNLCLNQHLSRNSLLFLKVMAYVQ